VVLATGRPRVEEGALTDERVALWNFEAESVSFLIYLYLPLLPLFVIVLILCCTSKNPPLSRFFWGGCSDRLYIFSRQTRRELEPYCNKGNKS
jgi:hypothetical protein